MGRSAPDSKAAMRRGYTTGACAQAAVRAAALTLIAGGVPPAAGGGGSRGITAAAETRSTGAVEITLPAGEKAIFEFVMDVPGICYVVKDAGDDPDITNGIRVIASVSRRDDGLFRIQGGEGVGRVTREGLAVRPGDAAINPAPLAAMRAEARALLPAGADVTLSIPGGGQLAARTFNPRLGIVGGLSVLGTTGRVEPWSSAAYQESLLPQLDVALAAGITEPVLVPGAKGERSALGAGCDPAAVVQAGNFFGMMLAAARDRGFARVTLVGHASKLAKLSRGDFDTHSRRSGMPLDVLADCAACAGMSPDQADAIGRMPTTEAAIRWLREAGAQEVLDQAAARVAERVEEEYGLRTRVLLSDGGGAIVGVSEARP